MSGKLLSTGMRVAFRLTDALCPEIEQLLAQIGPDLTVSGEVVLLSDRGGDKAHFAIVNVMGINAALIVPVQKLHEAAVDDVDVARHQS